MARVVVQGFDAGQQLGFGQAGVVLLQHRMQAGLFAGLDFVAHIDLAGGVVAHQHHGQAGRGAARAQVRLRAGPLRLAQLAGEGVAVDQLGCHSDDLQ